MNQMTKQDGVASIYFAFSHQNLFRGIENVPEDKRRALITDIAMCIYACVPEEILPIDTFSELAMQMAQETM